MRRPGIDVAGVGRGLMALLAARGMRSSDSNGSLVTGHLPVSWMIFSMRRFSKRWPDFFETTGISGTVPLTDLHWEWGGGRGGRVSK